MERSTAPRSEGYMIDFFGAGYDVAEKLGLLDALERIHYQIDHLTFVNAEGEITADLPYPRIREAIFHGRHFNFMRSDLERVLLATLPHGVEVWWGVTPDSLDVSDDGVVVHGSDGSCEDFDLVIGADGVHSSARALAFGPGSTNIVPLQARTVSFIVDHALPGLPANAFSSLSVKGMTAGAYPLRGGRMATFFIYRKEGPIPDRSAQYYRLELEYAFPATAGGVSTSCWMRSRMTGRCTSTKWCRSRCRAGPRVLSYCWVTPAAVYHCWQDRVHPWP